MRIGRFQTPDDPRSWCGVVRSTDTVIDVAAAGAAAGVDVPEGTTALLADWGWRRKVALAVDYAEESGIGVRDLDAVERHAPVQRPGKIVCVGLNYRDHAEEGGNPIPDEPVLFAKFPTTVTGPAGTIRWNPALSDRVDFEAELVVAIGRRTYEVAEADAMDHVAGYLVGNDVTARNLQRRDGQWVRGKSLDTFAPTGPALVTTDELEDPHDLDIWTEVNGERMQESNTSNLIFGVGELVAFCSQAFTLEPGDLIFTGTPPGVGTYRDPPVYLSDGDVVTVGIEDIGEISNPCEHR